MIEKQISIIMGLWSEGYFTEEEVIAWADSQIIKMDNDVYDPLIELSLKGPAACIKKPSYEFPSAIDLLFKEKFSVRLTKLDLSNQKAVKAFVHWIARNAMGEDYDIPEVKFGYQIDHYFDYDEIDPVVYFERNINKFIETSQVLVKSIIEQANA